LEGDDDFDGVDGNGIGASSSTLSEPTRCAGTTGVVFGVIGKAPAAVGLLVSGVLGIP
jgi:hypothetical protein